MGVNITSNFWGDVVDELFALAVTGNQIVEGGHIYVSDRIQRKRALPRLRMSNIIQPMAATPTPQGDFTIDERTLSPDDFLVYVEFDPNDFLDMWEDFAPTGEFLFHKLKPQVQADMLRALIEGENGVNGYMGAAILIGDKAAGVAPYNRFNGLNYKALNDADVVDIVGAAALTSSNIIAKMEEVYVASREAVRENPKFKYFLSATDHEKYREALVNLNYKSIDPTMAAPTKYHGKDIVRLASQVENTMFATVATADRGSNIWMGVRGVTDFSSVQVEKLQANSDLWFFKLKMAADTQIKFGQDFVLYRP